MGGFFDSTDGNWSPGISCQECGSQKIGGELFSAHAERVFKEQKGKENHYYALADGIKNILSEKNLDKNGKQ